MNDPHQNTPKQVVYYPPKPNEVERYARQVCRGWEETKSPDYGDLAFVGEFVRFIKLVVQINAKYMNREQMRNTP
jgi:hypothetical protein